MKDILLIPGEPKNWILSFCLFFFVNISAYNQTTSFLHLQTGVQSLSERDFGFSPLQYSGLRIAGSLAYARENTKKSNLITANFFYGTTSSRRGSSMDMFTASILTYSFYHHEKGGTQGLHLGWSNLNEFNLRFHRSWPNFNYRNDYFTSFGPAARYRLPFDWKGRQFAWENLANVQMAGIKVMSDFVSSEPRGFRNEESSHLSSLLNSADLFLIGRDWSLGFWSALNYELKSGNKIGIQYRYDFQKLEGPQRVVRSRGNLMLSLMVRL